MNRKVSMCFVTERDLDGPVAAGILNDRRILRCLQEFDGVEVIYLQNRKYKSIWLALLFLYLDVLGTLSKSVKVYFARGLSTCFILLSLKPFWKQRKLVYLAEAAYVSNEVKYLGFGKVERFVRYCVFRFLENVLIPRLDAITVPAYPYAIELEKNGVPKSKVHVLPYYIEDVFFEQPIKYKTKGNFTFGYVGSFHRYHDLFSLVEAFEIISKKDRDTDLVFVGNGKLRPNIENEVFKRNLKDRIRFQGKVPPALIPSLLSKVDCFIHLARAPGISTSLIEAAAAGKPIITLNKKEDATLTSYFKHRNEIYFVNSLSPEEIADSLELIREDSELRNSLSEGARNVARKYFSKEAMRIKLETLLSQISKK